MNVSALPFEKADIEVLYFEPWEKNKDKDLIFRTEEDDYLRIKSPYFWRSKELEKGDIVSVEIERSKNSFGMDKGSLIFISKLEF